MDGPRQARADCVAAPRLRRPGRAWLVAAWALLALLPAGIACFAGNDGAAGDAPLLVADARFARVAPDETTFRYHLPFDSPDDQRLARRMATPQRAALVDAQPRADAALNLYLPANDFSDRGPGTLSASFAGLDVDAVRSVAGGRMQMVASDGEHSRLLAEARLSWLFEYIQSDAAGSGFFSPGDKSIFAVQGLRYGSNWALVGWGVRWELFEGCSACAYYDAQANPQQLFHIGSGSFLYAW